MVVSLKPSGPGTVVGLELSGLGTVLKEGLKRSMTSTKRKQKAARVALVPDQESAWQDSLNDFLLQTTLTLSRSTY